MSCCGLKCMNRNETELEVTVIEGCWHSRAVSAFMDAVLCVILCASHACRPIQGFYEANTGARFCPARRMDYLVTLSRSALLAKLDYDKFKYLSLL